VRVLYAGTPDIAVPTLKTLARYTEVAAVLCNPDMPAGRKKLLTPPPVKKAAEELGIKIFQPDLLDGAFEKEVAALKADILVCFAYGKFFKKSLLSLFPLGGINIHPSLLPRWRGATPIPAAILAGDNETGITVQRLASKMDAGDIIVQKSFPLHGNETTESLSAYAAETAPALLIEALDILKSNPQAGTAQNEALATFCTVLKKEDGRIDFKNEDAAAIERKVRAFYPWPLAHAYIEGKALYIYQAKVAASSKNEAPAGSIIACDKKNGIEVKTKSGTLAILNLQMAGKKQLQCHDFLNGRADLNGRQFE
jgi:methionyl-tRNA formyltransferase